MITKKYFPGDVLVLPDGHKTLVVEIDENYWPVKIKSLEPDPQLGKIGWFYEGGDWVVYRYTILGGDYNN